MLVPVHTRSLGPAHLAALAPSHARWASFASVPRWPIVAQLLTVWSVPALTAAQDPTPTSVGAFPIEVEGKARSEARQRLQKSVREGLARTSLAVVPKSDVAAAAGPDGCKDAQCFVSVADKVGARYLLTTVVRVSGREYDLSITLVDGETGAEIATVSDSCQLCGLEEAAELLADVASSVSGEVERLEEGQPPHLLVHTAPDGADVYIDGKLAGQTPLDVEVAPGTHQVRVSAAGYFSEDREIAVAPDVRQRVVFNLQRDSSVVRILGWSGVAVGLAAVGAGSALLAIDEKPNRNQCSGPDVDADGDCRYRYDTLAGGAVLTIGGAALLAAVGVTALIMSDKRRASNRKRERRVRVQPTLDGLSVRF